MHDEPDREKIDAFALFARNLGVDTSPLKAKNTITPMQLSKILESAKEKNYFSIVSSILLRSLMKARYSSVQKAHFGLNTEFYCHFTSPIRRYPDLTVHRILKSFLNGEITEKTIEKYEKLATLSGDLSSENEVKAVHAEREIDELYKCVYMADRIDEEFDAVISSVTSFGFFARTENLCEGLVPIEALGNGFYYDKDNYMLLRGTVSYRLGMPVKVRVSDVDIALRQINFELVRENGSKEPRPRADRSVVREKIAAKREKRAYSHNKKTRKRRK